MKHLFLLLFFLMFTFSIALCGALYYIDHITAVKHYRRLARSFFFIALFLLFWYLSSYLALNVLHRETLLYTAIEAAAFLAVGAAAYFYLYGLTGVDNESGRSKTLLMALIIPATAILVFGKYSYYILGYHHWLFYHLKRFITLGLFGATAAVSGKFLRRPKGASVKFPRALRLALGTAGIVLPLLGALDILVIKDKFYEGAVRLSMNYPLFISGYAAFCLLLAALLCRQIMLMQNPTQLLHSFAQTYRLTSREMEVMELLLKGKSNREIAGSLCISLATVKNHANHIYTKLGVSSRVELISMILAGKKAK